MKKLSSESCCSEAAEAPQKTHASPPQGAPSGSSLLESATSGLSGVTDSLQSMHVNLLWLAVSAQKVIIIVFKVPPAIPDLPERGSGVSPPHMP